jgi:hypothetical protein
MPMASGLDSQLGFGVETTIGTRAVPTVFLPFLDEDIKYERERIPSKAIYPGRRVLSRWRVGKQEVKGPFKIEFAPQSTGKILRWMFGAVTTTGAGPYQHVFTPGNLDDDAITIQFGKPAEDGTILVADYLGCQCVDWSLGVKVGEYAILNTSIYGQHEDTSQTLAAASMPANWQPFAHLSTTLSIAGSDYPLDDVMITGDNKLQTGRHVIRATTPERPRPSKEGADLRAYGGTINSDFLSYAAYNRFRDGTTAALSMVMSDGAGAQLTIAGTVRFDGETPNVKGPGMLKQRLPFVFTHPSSDASAITATLVNSDATP